FSLDERNVKWQTLSSSQNMVYYGCYVAMIGLPIVYIVIGIGATTAIYYRKKLRIPILQLQESMERIQENDLDFEINYVADDELGRLCSSMEKMRKELRYNNKSLWEALEQRKLLNSSVAHDLRTPITVIRGYLDYLEKNIPQEKLTEAMVMDTLDDMQGAVSRLEQYVDCVRNIEKIESIEIKREPQDTALLLSEMKNTIYQLKGNKKIVFEANIPSRTVNVDKSVAFRILENLLQNALRYAKEQVNVEIYQEKNMFVISVKDDGKGFLEKDLEQTTNIFWKKESSEEHFGIGLRICKILCERHGGVLYIGNNMDGGACVIANLN
ncbi:MAG TPA: HAMP domain-containing histidine kinase, partial [Candidatus Merdenecus merdavium]|nr:HAMP domain-containing histidine kinase [Candidatus Merdenecus merdavium]